MQQLTWYLPSLFGDIRLDSKPEGKTLVTMEGLSPQERIALGVLFKRATKAPVLSGRAWTSQAEVDKIDLTRMTEQAILLDAPITDVQKVLEKPMKPMRKQVSAVRFTNGKIEQITESNIGFIEAAAKGELKEETTKPAPKKPVAAVTVAQPVIGCPAPDFDPAEVRATRVLSAFLTPEQREDFRTEQRFVVTGADTGHRYLLTSRHAAHANRHESFRCVFDIDENMPLCVHDWEVPAAEELLGLALHLTLPGLEGYVRQIPAEA